MTAADASNTDNTLNTDTVNHISNAPRTMFEKIWDAHVVRAEAGKPALLYIDLHLVHEVTSPQAFEGLRLTGRGVRRPHRTIATMDHNVPTTDRSLPVVDPIARQQMDTLAINCAEFGVTLYDVHSPQQGIVHIIGPEQGMTQPGMTICCGDSHTATHGAFGALAFGIGTSEVEHILATQCLPQSRPKTMQIDVSGELGPGVTAKDVILAIIGKIGTAGATGYVDRVHGRSHPFAFDGRPDDGLQHEHRSGRARGHDRARPDDLRLPQGTPVRAERARTGMSRSPPGANSPPTPARPTTRRSRSTARRSRPYVSWGTSPGMVAPRDRPRSRPRPDRRPRRPPRAGTCAGVHGPRARNALVDIPIDTVFIGSCTNGRIEDLRAAARILAGSRVKPGLRALCVPGSYPVKKQAEAEGSGPDLQIRRIRVARTRLLDVPRHEPRHPPTRRTLRLHLQPQLRGTPGQRRTNPPRQPRNGRRRRHRRTFRGRAGSREVSSQSPLMPGKGNIRIVESHRQCLQ